MLLLVHNTPAFAGVLMLRFFADGVVLAFEINKSCRNIFLREGLRHCTIRFNGLLDGLALAEGRGSVADKLEIARNTKT